MNMLEMIRNKYRIQTERELNGEIPIREIVPESEIEVQYLLSKLEIAEKALDKLSVQMPGSRDNELVLHRERLAAEALKSIRS
ncbi:hypothetical protein [Paenibacillus oleatilyticus]|uniref:hypothetical protein n=1 Tax=Paenibacillus oleatilyticus TaxID=2594886 RepID=UPI001C1F26F4|nr:hypothetical protein [Paenibacillus oleatilyticus]MBU7320835.1 hypothetical protein [Paenibacillus oleatilyticus]